MSSDAKSKWANPIWATIHIFAANMDGDNSDDMKKFLESIGGLLPCKYCRKHWNEKLAKYPPDSYLTNKHDAFFYTYFLHDLVNKHVSERNPKNKKVSPKFDVVKRKYMPLTNGDDCDFCNV